MFMFVIYPGAFVDPFTAHLNLISPVPQLHILCAGLSWVLCWGFGHPFEGLQCEGGGGHSSTYCVPNASLQFNCTAGRAYRRLDGTMECCSNSSLTDLCFAYSNNLESKLFACLPARKTIQASRTCRTNADCQTDFSPSLCVIPSLENQTRLIRVKHAPQADMLFVGYPSHLQFSVSLTNFVPQLGTFLHLDQPVMLETLSKYPSPCGQRPVSSVL